MHPMRMTIFLGSALLLVAGGSVLDVSRAQVMDSMSHDQDVAAPAAPHDRIMPSDETELAEIPVEGWQDWQNVSSQRFFSRMHGGAWVELYVPEMYADDFVNGTAPMPEGATIVKAHYSSEEASEADVITVMVKREEGYDADDGDWFYGKYTPDGTEALVQGRVESCIECHRAADGDYLFRRLE